ncbi:unnamed protein product, partial [Didymodactylos carnosus]
MLFQDEYPLQFLPFHVHNVLIDTSVLPSNIMSLHDDKFIDFVKAEAGDAAAALLEVQGQHYSISIQNDLDGVLKGNIKCCCEKWLSLTLRRGKFQMSNFYRHLQGLRNGNICNAMKEMINNSQPTSSLSTNNQQPFTTPDNVPQQILSPNLVPTISPLVTVPSISTSSTLSSVSISTEDESIRKPSSSLVTKRQ